MEQFLEEQFVFGSLVRTAGTLMVSPDLLQHVKEETEQEVLLNKNLRKAKERERERERARERERETDRDRQSPRPGSSDSSQDWSVAQLAVFDNVRNSVHELGPPPSGLDGVGALRQLHAFDGYGEDQTRA